MRVSLASAGDPQRDPRRGSSDVAAPLLDPSGPSVILGDGPMAGALMLEPLRPGPSTLFGPRGACLLREGGPLWVADTGHHRLLGWARLPEVDQAPADWVIGQPGFEREGRNAGGAPTRATVNVPTGITACGSGLAVADAWNHRVLLWREAPSASNVPPDVVLGQADGESGEPNRGRRRPGPDTFHWPYGVAWDGQRLWVSDAKNRRVLYWNGLPTSDGQRADGVLGQRDFHTADENAGAEPSAMSMRWPHQLARVGEGLVVADAGNNRLMIWREAPRAAGTPCDLILGQAGVHDVQHNRATYWPDAGGVNMPYGVATTARQLLVADTANSRLLGWDIEGLFTGAPATRLTGQVDFAAKGDNAWRPRTRTSLCWPYGLQISGKLVVVADSGNNRVLLWGLAA